MKALVFRGAGDVAVETRPDPVASDGEIVVKVESVGICGSEVEAYRGLSTRRRPPLVLGHELAVSKPEASDTRLYAVNPLFSCGTCVHCASGARNRCPQRTLLSLDRDGGHAQYLTVPATSLYPLAPGVTAAEGTMVEPLATVVNALGGSGADLADLAVTVIGAGTLGLLAVALSRHWGANPVTVIELHADRLRRGVEFGASSDTPPPRSQDVVVDTVGAAATQATAVSLCKPGGVVKAVGLHSATTQLSSLDLVAHELRIEGVYAYADAHFATAVELVGSQVLPVAALVSSVTLDDGPEMFRQLIDDPADLVKVVLEPW